MTFEVQFFPQDFVRHVAAGDVQCFPHIDFTWVGPGILKDAQVYLVTRFCFHKYYYLPDIM